MRKLCQSNFNGNHKLSGCVALYNMAQNRTQLPFSHTINGHKNPIAEIFNEVRIPGKPIRVHGLVT